MPYRISGNKILHKKGGKWSVKQRAKSSTSAKAALRLLRGIEHNPAFAKKVRARAKAKRKQ